MNSSLSDEMVRFLRMRAQQLVAGPAGAAEVARTVCGVQAQEAPAATLAIRARSTGLTAGDVDRALLEERSLVRTWAMRGTLHLLAAEDLGWLLALLGPRFIRGHARRFLELGLDEASVARGLKIIRAALESHGSLTRAEIAVQLGREGLPGEGQAPYHLIWQASLEGTICQGPLKEGEPAYVLVRDWIETGDPLPEEEARASLARRYLAACAPAGPEDLASWAGLPLSEARRGWESLAGQLREVHAAGRPAWMLAEQAGWLEEPAPPEPLVRLLPRFDNWLLGWESRDFSLAPEHARRIHPGGGILHQALLVDGRVLGRWRSKARRGALELSVETFEPLGDTLAPAIEAEAADLARFLGVEGDVRVRYED